MLCLLGGLAQAGFRPARAQRHAWQGAGCDYRRTVDLEPGTRPPAVVVTEFFSHGAPHAPLQDVPLVVYPHGRGQPVPCRVLQIGPGDLCRVAFEPAEQRLRYYVYYGGKGNERVKRPAWRVTGGLLLETRRWRPCKLRQLDSVRRAFAASTPIGSDYMTDVFQRQNPFAAAPAPFLSRYLGTIDIPRAGRYTFFTSSQDCSFLLIDGKLVVAAPGRHGPVHRGRFRGAVTLAAGPHRFEYLHAAAGRAACMVAAWQPPDAARPSRIPARQFGADRIARLPATRLEHRRDRFLPDFRVATVSAVSVEESDQWLVRAEFTNTTAQVASQAVRSHWDFGDGQTSDDRAPNHVFLHPGLYSVALTVRRSGKRLTTTNRVQITPLTVAAGRGKQPRDTLADYTPILETYNAARLDADGALQLVRVWLRTNQPARAVAVGQAALADKTIDRDDRFRWDLVQLLGPVLRDRMEDPAAALNLWRQASRLIRHRKWRAECAVRAADIALNDLLHRDEATPLLQLAHAALANETGPAASRFYRVQGDWYARGGQGDRARAAYQKALAARDSQRGTVQQNAWRGARGRSTEVLLREGKLNRARDELREWELDFPNDKIHGYWSLLLAQYWVARDRPRNAIAVANDLLAVNRHSPYADQLLLRAARCEEKLGHHDRAVAVLKSLLTDYPGSPLAGTARKELARLNKHS